MAALWAAAALCLGLAAAPRGAHAVLKVEGHDLNPLVVVGIGDSSTGGVKRLVQHFGVEMCDLHTRDSQTRLIKDFKRKRLRKKSQDKKPQDKKRANDGLGLRDIEYLLKHSDGNVLRGDNKRSKHFHAAVESQVNGSVMTLQCILDQRRGANTTVSEDFVWGYKNPNAIFLLPVMDAAFNRTQRVLAVVRDPRDVCSGSNRRQFMTEGPRGSRGRRRSKPPRRSQEETKMCFRLWANLWAHILTSYGRDPRFRVVRIEDLVLPDPTEPGNGAAKTLACVLQHVQVPDPTPESAASYLKLMHNHTDSYAGNGKKPKVKHGLVRWTKKLDVDRFREVMALLGYSRQRYELEQPGHVSVCK